ncbi:hypothetical protein B0H14DRAFT_2582364 [Mycena olivaceomarginata]|nr:hypothetical protein B0H14DRAFT_2582364 [Mycena olivaceomarginata]
MPLAGLEPTSELGAGSSILSDANFHLGNANVSLEEVGPILGDGMGFFARVSGHVPGKYKAGQGAAYIGNWRGDLLPSQHVESEWNGGFAGRRTVLQPGLPAFVCSDQLCNGLARYVLQHCLPIQCQVLAKDADAARALTTGALATEYDLEGKNHGEGVEQNWSFSNGAATSTKLMGPGSCTATLEDIFGFHNYDHQLVMYCVLLRHLTENIQEGTKHKVVLDVFIEGLERVCLEEVVEWWAWVEEWEATQHRTTEKCPFEYKEAVRMLQDIQLRIATKELLLTEDGIEVEQENTPSTFISMGLSIENQQCILECH